MRQYTTITDVTDALYDVDPGFRDELTEDQLQEIVREHKRGRYEDITDNDFANMIVAAYVATGVGRDEAERMLGA